MKDARLNLIRAALDYYASRADYGIMARAALKALDDLEREATTMTSGQLWLAEDPVLVIPIREAQE